MLRLLAASYGFVTARFNGRVPTAIEAKDVLSMKTENEILRRRPLWDEL